MIKYKIQTGAKHVNQEAQRLRDAFLKPNLKGMHCGTCKTDTNFEFYEEAGRTRYNINACCMNFKKRIEGKLNSVNL